MEEKKFNTVALIGSGRFKDEFEYTAKQLTKRGFRVLSSFLFKDDFNEKTPPGLYPMLDEMARENIDMSDIVYVINPDNYIGESTQKEIEYAVENFKPIRFFSSDFDPLYQIEESEMELLKSVIDETKHIVPKYDCMSAYPNVCVRCDEKDSCDVYLWCRNEVGE